ncbi:MAG: hypothetical protein FWE12_08925 [Oscillospiraceae bacterium]|nr:hypothetical protein [Oscillospiraceae bacterium]
MENIQRFAKNDTAFSIALAMAFLAMHFPFGLRYFTYMDDLAQYGIFYLLLDNPLGIFTHWQLYTDRPLASVVDVFLIAPLWHHLWIALFLMVALHYATVLLMNSTLRQSGLPHGKIFILVCSVYPFLAEGRYWLSASSRIVTSLFLLTLGVFLLVRALQQPTQTRKVATIAGGFFLTFLAQFFYEQTISFAFVYTLILLWFNRQHLKSKWDKLLYGIPAFHLFFVGAYYFAFRNYGTLGVRAGFFEGPLFAQIALVLRRIRLQFVPEQVFGVRNALSYGIADFAQNYALLTLFVAILCGLFVLFCVYSKQSEEERSPSPLIGAGLSVTLFFAAFAPFFLLEDSFLFMRSLFLPVIGIALFCQVIWTVLARFRLWAYLAILPLFGLLFLSMMLNILQVESYKYLEQDSNHITQGVIDELDRLNVDLDNLDNTGIIWLLGVRWIYEHEAISPHMHNLTLFDWSLSTNLQAMTGRRLLHDRGIFLRPILPGWEYNIDLHPEDILLGIDDTFRVRELRLENDRVYFADTSEWFGYLTTGAPGSFVRWR